MDATIAAILALDGLTNGAIYALLALATVLVFAVTRIIFIPQGEFVAFGALTMALLQAGQRPGTVWLLLIMAAAVAVLDVLQARREAWPMARWARRCMWPSAMNSAARAFGIFADGATVSPAATALPRSISFRAR